MKHTGEPEAGIALPYDQEPRSISTVVGLVIGGGAVVLPLLYLMYVAFVAAPVLFGLVVATVVLLLGGAFLGSRLYLST